MFQVITPDHEDKPNIHAYRITENISMLFWLHVCIESIYVVIS